ncbi:MAG: nucleotidyltransferase domain-containing protein [Solirubrobacterales bacterium]|nr:nucleotidyltransferase domain-containing protein [Solirubrobacterales bacterium]MCB0860653.1 nucleotidyltransferase domain-containing protein [Solirubrobacterales bacterium]
MEILAAEVARNLGIPDRSMRRAIDTGMIRGRRASERKFLVPVGEEVYLREHWKTLSRIRQVLRTEPNVRLAVLYGSVARGTEGPASDIDLMVTTAESSPETLGALTSRLGHKLNSEVQVVFHEDVAKSPAFLDSVLSEGRVIVDRDQEWRSIWKQGAKFDGSELGESMERFLNDS